MGAYWAAVLQDKNLVGRVVSSFFLVGWAVLSYAITISNSTIKAFYFTEKIG